MEIRELDKRDIGEAMKLVREVFDEFEAPGYAEEGIAEFSRFIEPEAVAKKMDAKEIALWGCFDGELVVGVIAAKNMNHISLLFVKKEYHLRGIARRLFGEVNRVCGQSGADSITVNSSPYAVQAYRHMGFEPEGGEQTVNGIRFVPMKYTF